MKAGGFNSGIVMGFLGGLAFTVVLQVLLQPVAPWRSCGSDVSQPAAALSGSKSKVLGPGPECSDWLASTKHEPHDPWNLVKWTNKPAACPVKGFALEELDAENNFRRGWTLGFSPDVEDRLHLLPFLLAAQDTSLHTRARRVYLDLGGNTFESSVLWFLRFYPLDFTEVHVLEGSSAVFQVPDRHDDAEDVLPKGFDSTGRRKAHPHMAPIPNWILDRITSHPLVVGREDGTTTFNGEQKEVCNITRFIKETLNLTAEDALVVKMDIEGSEHAILHDWLKDPLMPKIVDELFVEINYHHPTMSAHQWDIFSPTLQQSIKLLSSLRKAGFFVHPWP